MFEKSKPPKSVKIQGNSLYFFWKIYPFCATFFDKIKNLYFFHFFTKDISKRLLWGPETISVIYRVVFEKWAKKKLVLTVPSVRPSIRPSIKNRRGRLVPRGGSTGREYWKAGILFFLSFLYFSLLIFYIFSFLCLALPAFLFSFPFFFSFQ